MSCCGSTSCDEDTSRGLPTFFNLLPMLTIWAVNYLFALQAVGEYISVASQRDTEQADIEKERQQQAKGPEARQHELEELAEIYEQRGLSKALAHQV